MQKLRKAITDFVKDLDDESLAIVAGVVGEKVEAQRRRAAKVPTLDEITPDMSEEARAAPWKEIGRFERERNRAGGY